MIADKLRMMFYLKTDLPPGSGASVDPFANLPHLRIILTPERRLTFLK
jgi:hypothetical protein